MIAAVDAHKGTMEQRNISLNHVRKAVKNTVTSTTSEGGSYVTTQHEVVDIKHWLVLNAKVIDDAVPAEMIEQASRHPAECVPNPLDGAFE